MSRVGYGNRQTTQIHPPLNSRSPINLTPCTRILSPLRLLCPLRWDIVHGRALIPFMNAFFYLWDERAPLSSHRKWKRSCIWKEKTLREKLKNGNESMSSIFSCVMRALHTLNGTWKSSSISLKSKPCFLPEWQRSLGNERSLLPLSKKWAPISRSRKDKDVKRSPPKPTRRQSTRPQLFKQEKGSFVRGGGALSFPQPEGGEPSHDLFKREEIEELAHCSLGCGGAFAQEARSSFTSTNA